MRTLALLVMLLAACAPRSAVYEGEYFYNFENKYITPKGSTECWAVQGDMSKAELPATHKTGPWGFTSVVVRGSVSPEGHFGNMGFCKHQITVTELLEFTNQRAGP